MSDRPKDVFVRDTRMNELIADDASADGHYGDDYFQWQRHVGVFSAEADKFKFATEVTARDKVIDFGCGGGYILNALSCAEKIGVEVNPFARDQCRRLGIEARPSLDTIEDGWADVVISHHALEHVAEPFAALLAVARKLRPGGKAVFVVPCENIRTRYKPNDINNHLYTWSPLNLGNLFAAAGFRVETSKWLIHRWVPKARIVQRIVGWRLFHVLSTLTAVLRRDVTQVKIVASKT